MNIDKLTLIWSGAVIAWARRRDEYTASGFIHKCCSREFWRESSGRTRAAIIAAFALRPLMILLLAAYCSGRNGPQIKRRNGKGILRQFLEQTELAHAHCILPPWYYILEFYDDSKRHRAAEYLNRFETKHFAYRFVRKYRCAPMGAPDTTQFLSNKALFAQRCETYGLAVIPALLVAADNRLSHGFGGEEATALPRFDLFFKPLTGAGGRGAERWNYEKSGLYRSSDGMRRNEAELLDHLRALSERKRYIVRPRCVNRAEISDLGNGALSTVRVMTCRNECDECEVTTAVFRMAQGETAVVDNFHAGGIVAPVDIHTGVLGYGIDGGKLGGGARRFERHPDTGGRIAGRRLPCWQEVLDLARSAHAKAFADQITVGWDIALTDDGPKLVEGNKGPCVDLLQRPHGSPLGTSRFGELLAFNLKRAMALKYSGEEALRHGQRGWLRGPSPGSG
ncbi:MAG TPA: sugar-transfer associated ATP-grasp domain-containing protein [Nitrococcus sp.]|nr:sugar-transfer associated ATP-grasp domain-containing protein [Nitrococcus sp.]